MKVIGHYLVCIKDNVIISLWNSFPFSVNHSPCIIQNHFIIYYHTKSMFTILCA
jgi:hypothetical protein